MSMAIQTFAGMPFPAASLEPSDQQINALITWSAQHGANPEALDLSPAAQFLLNGSTDFQDTMDDMQSNMEELQADVADGTDASSAVEAMNADAQQLQDMA